MKTVMAVLARRPMREHEDAHHWMKVGMATVLDDGNVLITVDATPLGWDGELKLAPMQDMTWKEKKP